MTSERPHNGLGALQALDHQDDHYVHGRRRHQLHDLFPSPDRLTTILRPIVEVLCEQYSALGTISRPAAPSGRYRLFVLLGDLVI
jgi:hypothetical protein